MTTSAEDLKKRLVDGFDPAVYESMYRKMRYVLGKPMDGSIDRSSGTFPDYPDIVVNEKEIGQSNRILNVSTIALARAVYNQIEPEFPQVDKYTAEIRKQFYLERSKGNGYADGDWDAQDAAVFLDGDGLGRGVLKIGLRSNPETGQLKVDCKHVPSLQLLWDRNERHFSRARWVAFLTYMPVDLALATFGSKVKDYIRTMYGSDSSAPMETVRVFEYYDLGMGKGEPTMAYIPGDIDQDPIRIEKNPFGCLPCAHMEGYLFPGQREPEGRIIKQMPTQEAINELERKFREETLTGRSVDIMDPQQLDDVDVQNYMDGELGAIKRIQNMDKSRGPAFERIQGKTIDANDMLRWEALKQQFNEDSGTTDMDHGNYSEQVRTLGENQLLDARSRTAGSWSLKQMIKYHVRKVEKVMKIAAVGDTDPVALDIFGQNYTLNDPEYPNSAVSLWLEEHSRVVIGDDALTVTDAAQDRIERLNMLKQIEPWALQGAINPKWYVEELLKAIGTQDPKEALSPMLEAGMPMAPGMMPGMPMGQPTL